jgi:hypothetical protein
MSKTQSQARKQRRLYEKFLKKFNPVQYKEYKAGVLERGIKIHQANVDAVTKAEEARYEEIQNRIIQNMRAEGKSNEEIDSYIEDWVKTIKVWGSDSRPMRWREIQKEKLKEKND